MVIRKQIDAVFENGIFRPLRDNVLKLTDGQQVRLVVEADEPAQDVLALARKVYSGLSDDEIDEIEQIALSRGHFFGDRKSG